MILGRRRLNRTLLHRQHLLERVRLSPIELAGELLGLQAQEGLSPYLSLQARLADLDPREVSVALRSAELVRLLTMRGTIHLLPAADAGMLRRWVQPRLDTELRHAQNVRAARDLDADAFADALDQALADGPLSVGDLGARLAARFPGVPATALSGRARVAAALVQLPPRGCWGESGGVVYEPVERWTGVASREPDVDAVVRRYLRAFGPATAADVTAWSGVSGLARTLAALDGLRTYRDESGRTLYDVADGVLAAEDAPAPVRLLGTYDNLWLAHAGRDRVTSPQARAMWPGSNGGAGCVLLVDGYVEGLWRPENGRVVVTRLLRELTRAERQGLDQEVARVEGLLAV